MREKRMEVDMKPVDSDEAKENEGKSERIKKAIWWSIKWILLIALIRGILFLVFSC